MVNMVDNKETTKAGRTSIPVVVAAAVPARDTLAVTHWPCPKRRRPRSWLNRRERLLASSFRFLLQAVARATAMQAPEATLPPTNLEAAEVAVDTVVARVWLSVAVAEALAAAGPLSLSLLPRLATATTTMVRRAVSPTSNVVAAKVTAVASLVISRVTGGSLNRSLSSSSKTRTTRPKTWATST